MNKFHLLITAMFWLSLPKVIAQSLEARLQERISTLDLGQVPSGILYERSLECQPLKMLNGKSLNDSIKLSPNDFAFAYGMLLWADVDTTKRIEIDSYFDLVKSKENDTLIHIGLIAYSYDRFKPYAVDSNLIYIQNDHLYDTPNRTESPYLSDTTYATSVFAKEVYKKNLTFVLDTSFFKSNFLTSSDSLFINFSDGLGWRFTEIGDTLRIEYSDYGSYFIKIKIKLANGIERLAQDFLVVKAQPFGSFLPPSGYAGVPDDSIKIGPAGQGVMVYVFLRDKCGDKKIRKPFILIEGFDPTNKYNWQFAMNPINGLLNQKYELQENLSNYLNLEDYDIFFINYMDGTDYIQNNADWVRQAIIEINNRKHQAGSIEKNVVVGASMGGLVGKWALRSMENDNVDHESEFFISIDSPLKGANVPLGLQKMVDHLANTKVFGEKLKERKEELKIAFETVNTPAAKQMLLYHYSACPDSECDASEFSSFHDEFQTAFEALGNLEIPHYAISNGAINKDGSGRGVGQEFDPGDILLAGVYCLTCSDWIGLFVTLQQEVVIKALPENNSEYQDVYNGNILIHVVFIPDEDEEVLRIRYAKPYDSAPGGMRTMITIENGLKVNKPYSFTHPAFGFIPTISSLALDTDDPYFESLDLEDKEGIIQGGHTYLLDYEGSTEEGPRFLRDNSFLDVNMEHVSLDRRLAKWLLGKSTTGNDLTDPLKTTYNFGEVAFSDLDSRFKKTRNIIDFDLDILDLGKLWSNRDDRIAYTDNNANGYNKSKENINVYIKGAFCGEDSTEVTVHDGGEIIIGDINHGFVSKLHILDSGKVIIGHDGSVFVESYSQIQIYSKGKMIVDDGGLLHAEGESKIVINSGGIIEIKEGGKLFLEDLVKLEVRSGGRLIIHEGAIIEMNDPVYTDGRTTIHIRKDGVLQINGIYDFLGNGYLQFDKENILELEGDAFALKGKEKGIQFIRLNTDAELLIGDKDLILSRGKVVYAHGTAIISNEMADISIDSTVFVGVYAPLGLRSEARALQINRPQYFNVRVCDFAYLTYGIDGYNLNVNNSGINMDVSDSYFDHTTVKVVNAEKIKFFRDTLIETLYSLNQVKYSDIKQINGTTSTISGNGSKYMVFQQCQMQACEVAIRATSNIVNHNANGGNNTNVFIHNSSFNGNGIVVQAYGKDWYPCVVEMGCSSFLDNGFVVEGSDAILHLDANSGTGGAYGVLGSNRFRKDPADIYFFVCYSNAAAFQISEVLARMNYWYNYLPGTYPDDYYLNDCPQSFTYQYPLIYSPYLSFPVACPTIDDTQIATCSTNGVGSNEDIHELFFEAYSEFLEGNYADAETMMQPISDIDNFTRSQVSADCRKYIDVARAFYYFEEESEPIVIINTNNTVDARIVNVYPNPTNGDFVIILDKKYKCDELYLNTLDGRRIQEYKLEGGERRINVNSVDLPKGIILLEVKGNNLHSFYKLSVN